MAERFHVWQLLIHDAMAWMLRIRSGVSWGTATIRHPYLIPSPTSGHCSSNKRDRQNTKRLRQSEGP